jgi:signal transduction histidine kinase
MDTQRRTNRFIEQHVDRIVEEWEHFADLITAQDSLDRATLRDHARSILLATARDMCTAQSASEQAAKAMGDGPDKTPNLDEATASHGELRHTAGFDLVQMTPEFRHLRACVIRLWVNSLDTPDLEYFQDMIRFNEAIDQALAESTAAYAEQVNHSRDIFLAILGHDLRAPLQAAIAEACAGNPECDPTVHIQGDTHGEWDAGRLDQLLQNLIGNALQHGSNPRDVTLTLNGDGEQVCIKLHNFGTPIPPETISTIFDPLVRSTNEELGQPSTSLGLGLFIVKEVVMAHQGTIEVSSSETDGTLFTVMLPRSV